MRIKRKVFDRYKHKKFLISLLDFSTLPIVEKMDGG